MISSVTTEIGETTQTLRLTTRAMMAVEAQLGRGIVSVIESMESDTRVETIATLLAECMNDGRGAPLEQAQSAIDALGFTDAVQVLAKVIEAAFPEASGANPTKAGQPKQ